MGWLISGIIVSIVIAIFVWSYSDMLKFKKKAYLASLIGLVFVGIGCVSSVPTGNTGILTTFGKVENVTLEAGVQFKAPWQSVVLMDNREQKKSFEMASFSSDIQQVDIKGSINFSINKSVAMQLYQNVGTGYYDTLILPRLLESAKEVFSKYTAAGLIASRDALSDKIYSEITSGMGEYGVNIIKVTIEDIDFTDAYTNAVEAKQVAEQEKLKAETDQARITAEQTAMSQREIIKANAEAESRMSLADAAAYETRVQADAEAEANTKVARSVTSTLIEYVKWTKWGGELPDVMLGDSAVPVLNLGSVSD